MEKQGIITGIGNTITPEIDAVINDFIVGENAIIKGLDWVRDILNAGMCQLCGYRGVLKQTITTTETDKYVYGVFVLHFNEQREDEFYIETTSTAKTTNVNPTSITSAGTYYLLLYTNKTTTLPTYKYPKQAHTSERARNLIAGGTIYSTATTDTAPVNDNSNRVANTEYVHNQIAAEIDAEERTYVYEYNNASTYINKAEMTLVRRARLCVIKGKAITTTTTYSSIIFHSNAEGRILLFNIGKSKPSSRYNLGTMSCRHTVGVTSTQVTATVYIETDGNVFIGEKNTFGSDKNVTIEQNNTNSNLGYEI
jgi:hypothetical protein